MTQIQHFFPGGQTDVHYDNYSIRIQKLLAPLMKDGSLELSDWQEVPDSSYEFSFQNFQGIDCLVFKEGSDSYVYVSVFRLPNELPDPLMELIAGFYKEHGFGDPAVPAHPFWIHSFPLGSRPRADELSWMHEIILFVYYTKLNLWMGQDAGAKVRYLSRQLPVIPVGGCVLPKAN